MGEVATEYGRGFPDTEARLAFVKFEYLIWGYIPTIPDVYLGNAFIGEPVAHERKVQRVLPTDRFGTSGHRINRYVLVSGGGEVDSGLCISKVLLSPEGLKKSFQRDVEKNNKV